MKLLITFSLLLSIFTGALHAQSPQKFRFQGVARDATGKVLTAGSTIKTVQFVVHQSSGNGQVMYDEAHADVIVGQGGIFNLEVGGGVPAGGTMASIDWSNGTYFLQVQVELGNGSVTDIGSTQILSVPFALHSTTADSWKQNAPVVQSGIYNGGAQLGAIGDGSRLIWYPRKAAFCAGYTLESIWNDAGIGVASVAMGSQTRAKGTGAAAFGYKSYADGLYSGAMGESSLAAGESSFSFGKKAVSKAFGSVVVGAYNDVQDNPANNFAGISGFDRIFQVGNGFNDQNLSNALTVLRNGNVGIGNNVLKPEFRLDVGGRARIRHSNGTAGIHFDNSAGEQTGFVGMATDKKIGLYIGTNWAFKVTDAGGIEGGNNTNAYGANAFAHGLNTWAEGNQSVAFGEGSIAKAWGATTIGTWNNVQDNPVGNKAGLDGTDRIFQIGNGTAPNNLSNVLTVLRNGNVGIGNHSMEPSHALDVSGRARMRYVTTTPGIYFDNALNNSIGFVGLYNNNTIGFYIGDTWRVQVTTLGGILLDGNVGVTGTISESSDRRLKRDFTPLSASLTKISHLNGYHYYWKDKAQDQSLQTGVIAQEVEELFPELVKTDEKGFKSVNYSGLIPHLIESVKELARENEMLKSTNADLKVQHKRTGERLSDLEAKINALSQSVGPGIGK